MKNLTKKAINRLGAAGATSYMPESQIGPASFTKSFSLPREETGEISVLNMVGSFGQRIFIICALLILVISAGCGGKKGSSSAPNPEVPPAATPGAAQWTYGSNAVVLRIQADSMLNSFDDNPHTLVLCVYQFSNPNSFKNLAQNKEGVLKLLACDKYDASVASAQRIYLQPAELRELFLDRAQGAQYIALVAGYFNLKPKAATRLMQVPVDVVEKGLIFKDKYILPRRLYSSLYFGPSEIMEQAVVPPTEADQGALVDVTSSPGTSGGGGAAGGAAKKPPADSGAAKKPPADAGAAKKPPAEAGAAQSPPADSGAAQTPPADSGVAQTPPDSGSAGAAVEQDAKELTGSGKGIIKDAATDVAADKAEEAVK